MLEETSILPVEWIETRLRELNPDGVPMGHGSNEYYAHHKEAMLDTQRRWRKDNPDKAKAIWDRSWSKPLAKALHHIRIIKRRALKLNCEGSHTVEEWGARKAQYHFRCAYCHRKAKLTEDHIVPLSKGGSNDIENIVPACKHCNSSKGIKIPFPFQPSLKLK